MTSSTCLTSVQPNSKSVANPPRPTAHWPKFTEINREPFPLEFDPKAAGSVRVCVILRLHDKIFLKIQILIRNKRIQTYVRSIMCMKVMFGVWQCGVLHFVFCKIQKTEELNSVHARQSRQGQEQHTYTNCNNNSVVTIAVTLSLFDSGTLGKMHPKQSLALHLTPPDFYKTYSCL